MHHQPHKILHLVRLIVHRKRITRFCELWMWHQTLTCSLIFVSLPLMPVVIFLPVFFLICISFRETKWICLEPQTAIITLKLMSARDFWMRPTVLVVFNWNKLLGFFTWRPNFKWDSVSPRLSTVSAFPQLLWWVLSMQAEWGVMDIRSKQTDSKTQPS